MFTGTIHTPRNSTLVFSSISGRKRRYFTLLMLPYLDVLFNKQTLIHIHSPLSIQNSPIPISAFFFQIISHTKEPKLSNLQPKQFNPLLKSNIYPHTTSSPTPLVYPSKLSNPNPIHSAHYQISFFPNISSSAATISFEPAAPPTPPLVLATIPSITTINHNHAPSRRQAT